MSGTLAAPVRIAGAGTARIWMTRGLSNTRPAIERMRADPRAVGIEVLASHTDPEARVALAVDEFLLEPPGLTGPDYAAWVLATARARGVDLVVAQRQPGALADAAEAFDAAGVRLSVPGSSEVLRLCDDKLRFQETLAEDRRAGRLADPVIGHGAREFGTAAGFDAAWEEMAPEAPDGLCVKPVTGIFGAGFRRLLDDDGDLGRILSGAEGDLQTLSRGAFRRALAQDEAARPDAPRPRLILMPYLPGFEHSIDVAALGGRTLAAVARVKTGRFREMSLRGPGIEIAAALVARFGLSGMVNVQTREAGGRHHVLEINPRMSGGLEMSCLTGLNLPLIAVMAALGRDVAPLLEGGRPGRAYMREVAELVD